MTYLLALVFLALNGIDYYLTRLLCDRIGIEGEGNPLMVWVHGLGGWGLVLALKMFVSGSAAVWWVTADHIRPGLGKWSLVIGVTVLTAVVAWNCFNLGILLGAGQ